SEMIVWGGYSYDGVDHYWNTGGRYNPGTDGWVATSTTNAPVGRESQQAVWTGNEMIVWGGYYYDGNDHYLNTGGRYNPSTNSWAATGTTNAPSARASHKAVWTGLEMIVWGGGDGVNYLNTGGKYNTGTNNWMPISNTGAPSARTSHTATWSGSEMIVWGGYFFDISGDHYLETGGRYNPITNSWTPTSITNVPDGRALHTAVWTGSEMIVWGGLASEDTPYFDSGGRYDPGTDSWTATSTPIARVGESANRQRSRRIAVSPFLPFAVSFFLAQVTISLPFLVRVWNRFGVLRKICLPSLEAPAQYRRSDIESHGVSCDSASILK